MAKRVKVPNFQKASDQGGLGHQGSYVQGGGYRAEARRKVREEQDDEGVGLGRCWAWWK